MRETKRPNNTGGIRKLSGRRRKPYQAVVSSGHYIKDGMVKVKQVSLGCYATKKEALDALAVWQTNHLRVDLMSLTVSDIYMKIKDDWTPDMQAAMKSVYKRYLPLAKMRLCDVKTYSIESIDLPPLSKSSHDHIRLFWHRIFMFGIENDIVLKDYSQFIKFKETKQKQKKQIFTPEEIRELKTDKLYRILLYTGMRINELLTMESAQVYEEDGILCFHVLNAKTEAGNRIIPVHSRIMNDINLLNGYVITPKLSYMTANRKLQKTIEDKGLSQHTLHDFRRTFASYAKSFGMDEYYRKCLLGHAHEDLTDSVYTQAFVKDLKEQIEKIRYL